MKPIRIGTITTAGFLAIGLADPANAANSAEITSARENEDNSPISYSCSRDQAEPSGYRDVEGARELNDRGHDALRAKEFAKAIKYFNEADRIAPDELRGKQHHPRGDAYRKAYEEKEKLREGKRTIRTESAALKKLETLKKDVELLECALFHYNTHLKDPVHAEDEDDCRKKKDSASESLSKAREHIATLEEILKQIAVSRNRLSHLKIKQSHLKSLRKHENELARHKRTPEIIQKKLRRGQRRASIGFMGVGLGIASLAAMTISLAIGEATDREGAELVLGPDLSQERLRLLADRGSQSNRVAWVTGIAGGVVFALGATAALVAPRRMKDAADEMTRVAGEMRDTRREVLIDCQGIRDEDHELDKIDGDAKGDDETEARIREAEQAIMVLEQEIGEKCQEIRPNPLESTGTTQDNARSRQKLGAREQGQELDTGGERGRKAFTKTTVRFGLGGLEVRF